LVPLCLISAGFFSWLLYHKSFFWGKDVSKPLMLIRFLLLFIVSFLLLGPVVSFFNRKKIKPLVVLLQDNSSSITASDSAVGTGLIKKVTQFKSDLEKAGYAVAVRGLDGVSDPVAFNAGKSDLAGSIRIAQQEFATENLSSIVLFSDGVYNSGMSPVNAAFTVPVHTVGLGDTLVKKDLQVKSVISNRIVYQGNKFPLKAEILAQNVEAGNCIVTIQHKGKVVVRMTKPLKSGRNFITTDFELEANDPGISRYDVTVSGVVGEQNLLNNRASVFIEVVEGKKNILTIAASPHPDIGALRDVVLKNERYEFILHIPGVVEASPEVLKKGGADLVVLHQAPDNQNKTRSLVAAAISNKTPILFITGQQSEFSAFQQLSIPVVFESGRQWDETFGVLQSEFEFFRPEQALVDMLPKLPPLVSPFGKITVPAETSTLLSQRVGSVATGRPLLFFFERNDTRYGFLAGEGIWRWRMREFDLHEKHEAVDDLIFKTIQYLSTTEDKRKFRVFPIEKEFDEAAPAMLEAQIYDDVYRPVFGFPVSISIQDENGKTQNFSITPEPGQSTLSVSLPEGVYNYTAVLKRKQLTEKDQGTFTVQKKNLELQDLTADFTLMRSVATQSGGIFSRLDESESQILKPLTAEVPPALLDADQSFQPLIELKYLLLALILLASIEWFTRKYLGAY